MAKTERTRCPHCGLQLNFRHSSIGSIIRCKGCGGKIELRQSSGFVKLQLGCAGLVLVLGCGGMGWVLFFSPSHKKATESEQVIQKEGERRAAWEQAELEPRNRTRLGEEAAAKAAREEQEAKNREEAERIAREQAERKAKNEAEKDRFEKETRAYQIAKAECEAARKLSMARTLADDAISEKRRGNASQADKLLARATARYEDIAKDYPDTQSAVDAQELLDGKNPAPRPVPPSPTPPAPPVLLSETLPDSQTPNDAAWVLVEGEDPQLFEAGSPTSSLKFVSDAGEARTLRVYGRRKSNDSPALAWILLSEEDARLLTGSSNTWTVLSLTGMSKPVYVHGYYRKDGVYVQSHSRAAPGMRGRSSAGGRKR